MIRRYLSFLPVILFWVWLPKLSLAASPSRLHITARGVGTIAASPDKAGYNVGDEVVLTATGGTNWLFSQWLDGNRNNPRKVTLNSSDEYTAVFTNIVSMAEVYSVEWDRSFGGTGFDELRAIQSTTDGGFLLGGYSSSGINGSKTAQNRGGDDYWVVKLDANGSKRWDKSFGGSLEERCAAIAPTADGGFVLAGGSLSGIGGNKSTAGFGSSDYWLVKMDANGNKEWDRTFGGNAADYGRLILPTTDGGYLVGGFSRSGINGNKTASNFGGDDYWVLKIDANGNKLWDRTYGGTGADELRAMTSTGDGGFLLGGYSPSGINGNKSSAPFGGNDYWVVKIAANGDKIWEFAAGGTGDDQLWSMERTVDGGFLLGGYSASGSTGNKTSLNFGGFDYWIVKIDANGNKEWDRSFGGTGDDQLRTIKPTADSGFLLGGESLSMLGGSKSAGGLGSADYWLVKIDANGNKEWDRAFGGTADDYGRLIEATTDGGYLFGGYSQSGITGNKSSASLGSADYFLLKLKVELMSTGSPLALTNPSLSAGTFGFQVNSGFQFELESSEDLVHWTLWTENRRQDNSFFETNTVIFHRKFFRAVSNR